MILDQYRDPWLGEKFDEFVGFYPREFYVLDNFSSFGIMMAGEIYSTVEHAYQAGKFAESYIVSYADSIDADVMHCVSYPRNAINPIMQNYIYKSDNQ